MNNAMVLLGLLVGHATDPEQLGTAQYDDSNFIENQISTPNQLTAPSFSLLYSLLRHHLSAGDDAATMIIFPLLLELYRNHLPKFGKIFFQEELVQQLVSILYPVEAEKKKLSPSVSHAEKLILDLIIALFTNSVSLGSGSIVFKNVCDAILGISPPPGTTPTQQKCVFTLLVDALQSFIRLTNLPWNWPVHLEYAQRLMTIENLSYFLTRTVERIWEFDCYTNCLYDLCHTMANLLVRSRTNRAPKSVLESIELTLWRCLSLNMCQATSTEREQLTAAAAVELIIEFKAVLFPYAAEGPKDCIEYALVLAHCLFQLSGDAGGRKFIDEGTGNENQTFNEQAIHESLQKAITSSWNILLAARCLEFESHCRVSIPPGSSIEVGRLLLRDMAHKQWVLFYERIKPKQAQSGGMLRKMSGSLGKLTSASRRALQVKRTASVSDAMSWLRIESDGLREQIVNEITDKNHYDKRLLQEAALDWKEMHLSEGNNRGFITFYIARKFVHHVQIKLFFLKTH